MINIASDNKQSAIWHEIRSLILIAIIALFIRTFIMEPFFVPSGSMKPTLLEGDYPFATKFDYGYSKYSFLFFTPHFIKGRILGADPSQGDIIIFKSTHDNMERRYIKRLIGLPGDKIQMVSGVLYINDKAVSKEYLGIVTDNKNTYKKYEEILPNGVKHKTYYIPEEKKKAYDMMLDNTKAFYVPDEHYFLMGDNRNESNDSRLDVGFVPYENLIAKAQFILFSTEELLWLENSSFKEQIEQIYIWAASVRWNRLFNSVYGL